MVSIGQWDRTKRQELKESEQGSAHLSAEAEAQSIDAERFDMDAIDLASRSGEQNLAPQSQLVPASRPLRGLVTPLAPRAG